MTQFGNMKVGSPKWQTKAEKATKDDAPDALLAYGGLYIRAKVVRMKLRQVEDRMLKDYQNKARENFQNQLDHGIDIDIRASEKNLKQFCKDYRMMFDKLDDYIAETEELNMRVML